MPFVSSFYRISYLQQNQENLDSTQLLEWLGFAKETIEINEQTINQLVSEQEELIIQLSELQKEINKKADQYQTIEAEATQKLYQLIRELEQKEQQNQELQQQNEVLEKELTKLQKKFVQENELKEIIISDLQTTIQQQNENINNFQQRIQSLNQKQKKARRSKQNLEKQLATFFSDETQKEIKIQKLKSSLNYQKDKIIDLTKIQQELIKNNQETSAENQQLQTDLEIISEKLIASEEKNSILEGKVEELRDELWNWNGERVSRLEEELEEQKQDCQVLEQKYQTLCQTSQKLKQELAEQQEKGKDGWSWGQIFWIGLAGVVIVGLILGWKKIKGWF